jgi:hypothetical protein
MRKDLFWHLTALRNMENILKNGLWSRKKLLDSNIEGIIFDPFAEEREKIGLNEYVPFHFLVWNPLDISLLKENEKNVKKETHCFITIKQETARELKSKIVFEYPNHKNNLELINYDDKCMPTIDKIRNETDYSNGKQKLRALGECLVLDHVDSKYFYSIIVETEKDKTELEKIMKKISILTCRVYVEFGYFHPNYI